MRRRKMNKKKTQAQELLEKAWDDAKEIEEMPVEVLGLNEEQAYQVGQLFQIIDSNAMASIRSTLTDLDYQKQSIAKHLDFYKRLHLILSRSSTKSLPIYKELEEKIKVLEDEVLPIQENINRIVEMEKFANEHIQKLKDKIDIYYNDDKTVCYWSYDTKYFEAMLDLAVLTLPISRLPEKEQENTDSTDEGNETQ